jgi:hypothetical protein
MVVGGQGRGALDDEVHDDAGKGARRARKIPLL